MTTTNPTGPVFIPPPQPTSPEDLNGHGPTLSGPRYINGVEVVAVEQATAEHPNTRKIVPFKNITKALLADDTEVYLCDGPEDCDYYADSAASVSAHRSGHRIRNRYGSLYNPDTLEKIIRTAKVAKRDQGQAWAQHAADTLNEQGMQTTQKKPFTSHVVASLLRAYGDKVKVRLPGPGRPAGVKDGEGKVVQAARAKAAAAMAPDVAGLVRSLAELSHDAEGIARRADLLRVAVESGQYAPTPDPLLAAKAAKWDEMQALLGRQ